MHFGGSLVHQPERGIKWVAWNKLSIARKRGGLGLIDPHGFNLALLGKQCWHLLNKPEALVSRVLKARYYPNCHLLRASRMGGASYTWSGIWEAKEEMKKGLRWVLGDGRTINIGSDCWLREKESFCINQEESDNMLMNLKVGDFFLEDRKAWDVDKIKLYFNDEDANAILNTRIP